jgi:hypothetical protein
LKLGVLIAYSDIFDGESPLVEDLLRDIPFESIVIFSTYLNSAFYHKNQAISQIGILSELLTGSNEELLRKVLVISSKRSRGDLGSAHFFFRESLLHLTYYGLKYSDKSKDGDCISSEEYKKLFQAVLVCNDLCTKGQVFKPLFSKAGITESSYRDFIWSLSIEQVPFVLRAYPWVILPKVLYIFEYLSKNKDFDYKVDDFFLNRFGVKPEVFFTKIAILFANAMTSDKVTLYFNLDDELNKLLCHLSLNADDLIKIDDYHGAINLFCQKPLIFHKGRAYILDWEIFLMKVERGVLIDFYDQNKSRLPFKNWLEFKSHLASKFTENILFKTLVNKMFSSYAHSGFGENRKMPDAVVFDRNTLFVFELKDTWLSRNSLKYGELESLKNEIDNKFNSKSKGVGQLLREIQAELVHGKLSRILFHNKQKINCIQPVIIYTDKNFAIPGVASYLADEFLRKRDIVDSRIHVNELCFLSMDTLLNYSAAIREVGVKALFRTLTQEIRKRKREFKKSPSKDKLKLIEKMMQSHDDMVENLLAGRYFKEPTPFDTWDKLIITPKLT